jgi:hypothetical protein
MSTDGDPSTGALPRSWFVGLLLCLTSACATSAKEVRPHLDVRPGNDVDTGTLIYVFPIPAVEAHEALVDLLRTHFPISHVRAGQKSDLQAFNGYSKIRTDFHRYKDGGKEYREKCDAAVYVIPEYPSYSEVDVSCVRDVYELGLIHGRGGIHNLFTQWWDWYPERGLYVAEDLLESLSKKLGLKEDEVLRLAKKNVYPKEEVLQLIKEHQAQRPK